MQALADTAKRYLEAHNTKYAHKTQRAYAEERSEGSSGGEAELRISRFDLLVGLKVTDQQGSLFDNPLETAVSKGKSIPAKRASPHLNIRPRLL